MSRIDRALRIREGGAGAVPTDMPDVPAGTAPALQQYDREERVTVIQRDAPERPAVEIVESTEASTNRVELTQGRSRPSRTSVDDDRQARLVTAAATGVAVEQYRKLAAVLHDEQVQSELKSVMITSALPGEGKTLTALNLALTLSGAYQRRVLLIDADLRGPSLHRALDLPNDCGLGDALRDRKELPVIEVSSGLSVILAGSPGPTPLAGLTSKRMGEIVEHCAARFDWVIIDTPPVGVLPDAQVLARLVGAVLFVIGAGSTPAATVERSIAELGGPDAIFGIVLNRVDERRIPEADYYGQYQAAPSK